MHEMQTLWYRLMSDAGNLLEHATYLKNLRKEIDDLPHTTKGRIIERT